MGEGGVWLSVQTDGVVQQLDGDGHHVRHISVGEGPTGVAVGAGSVWVANSGDGTVSRIDPTAGKVIATIEVGGRADEVAVGEGAVWVNVYPA